MKPMNELIASVMRTGLWISVIIVSVGGALYLWQMGSEPIPYQTLQYHTNTPTSVLSMLKQVFAFSPAGLINLGLFILVLTQVVRVALTGYLFIIEKDFLFSLISGVILIILIYSIFWGG